MLMRMPHTLMPLCPHTRVPFYPHARVPSHLPLHPHTLMPLRECASTCAGVHFTHTFLPSYLSSSIPVPSSFTFIHSFSQSGMALGQVRRALAPGTIFTTGAAVEVRHGRRWWPATLLSPNRQACPLVKWKVWYDDTGEYECGICESRMRMATERPPTLSLGHTAALTTALNTDPFPRNTDEVAEAPPSLDGSSSKKRKACVATPSSL